MGETLMDSQVVMNAPTAIVAIASKEAASLTPTIAAENATMAIEVMVL